jgi:hypothetical protein
MLLQERVDPYHCGEGKGSDAAKAGRIGIGRVGAGREVTDVQLGIIEATAASTVFSFSCTECSCRDESIRITPLCEGQS